MKLFCSAAFLLNIFILSFAGISAKAQTFNYKTSEASSIVTGRDLAVSGLPVTLTTWCNEWPKLIGGPTTWGDSLKFKSLHSFLKFQVDNKHPIQQLDYTYQLTYELHGYYTMSDTTLYNTINDTLTISNVSYMDPLNAYQDINLAKFSNYYKTVVILTGIYAFSIGGTPSPAVLTDTMRFNYNIESSILSQRYDKISATYGPYYGNSFSLQITPDPHPDKNYLSVFFNFAASDTSVIQYTPLNYELEWTFVDDYSTDVPTETRSTISSSDLSYDFSHNCTRVWLNDNRYKIPLAYPSGYVIYRVRTVRPDSILFKYPIYSDWSYSTTDNGTLASLNADALYHIGTPYTGDSLNWQYTISFAEGGRYKHVVSFYDGLLKNRESITRFNSTPDRLIVTKNIYDFEGRPAIKILPTPVSSYAFGFVHDVDLNSATSLPYKADDFDTAMHTCPVDARLSPLATGALASVYYSSLNSDTAGVQKFVPDAEGYPLVHTQFSPAINDRVEKQGGAGPRLQIADSNIISNYYVGAGQKELDRYFGVNIGFHSFYNKVLTRDPNMQMSLSVKDYKGHQVLSAMSGRGWKPEDHAIIPADAPDSVFYNEDVLSGARQTWTDHTKIYNDFFHNATTGTVTFQYLYDFKPLKVCDSLFLGIGAKYNYYVTNQCGDTVATDDSVISHSGISTSYAPYVGNVISATLDEGDYTLHKELTVEEDSIRSVIDQALNSSFSCLLSEPYFIKKRVKEMDFPCKAPDDYCTVRRKELKYELHPYEKYGGMSAHWTGPLVVGNGNSVFTIMGYDTVSNNGHLEYHPRYRYQDTCTSFSLPDTITVAGITYTNLRTMSADSFLQIYIASTFDPLDPIAEALLPLHPEYCKLERCFTDTFGARLLAIDDFHIAEHYNLLYLDSIISQDPVVPLMISAGYLPDSLAYFVGGHIRLDSFLYSSVYCSCGDSVMNKECINNIYGYEIQNRLLINDFVKKAYFDQLVGMYMINRQRFIDLVINGAGDSCAHCADVRMILTPTPVFNNAVTSSGLTPPILLDSSWTGMAHAPWLMSAFATMPGYGTTAMDTFLLVMHDSATAICAAADSVLCFGRVDNIMAHLVNCANNDTITLSIIRNTLDSMCSAHAVAYGGFTPEIIRYAILRSGASLTDFCNPYLVACDFAGPSFSSGQNCRSDSFYRSFNGFLNKTAVLNSLRNISSIYPHTLDIAASEMELELYNVIGHDHVEMFADWSITDTLYKLYVYKDHTLGVSDTVKLYFRGVGGCGNVFSLGDSISVYDVSCINTLTSAPALGLIKQYSFVADAVWYQHTMSGITVNVCSMLGWSDTVKTLNTGDNVIAECVPCTQMRSLYKEFNDSMLAIHVWGPGHPLYGDMLRNFMNRKLGKVFGTHQYENFIESCALADSIAMPLYLGYSVISFANNDDADTFTVRYNRLDTNYAFDYLLRFKDGTGSVSIFVDFDIVPFNLLWKYKLFIDTFTGPNLTKLTDVSVGTSGGLLGYVFAPPGTVIPSAATLFGSGGTVSINSSGTYGLWVGNHYLAQDVYTLQSIPGTTLPWEISRDVYELQRYIYNNPSAGIAYYNTYQSAINEDFFRPEKIDYLNYAYGYQGLPPYEVLDALQAVYLDANIPSYSGRLSTYNNILNPNLVTNLYMVDTTVERIDIFQQTIVGVMNDNPVGVGHLFFDTSVMDIYGDSSLLAIRCADNSYWYMYFGAGDTLWNTYIAMPAWVPVWTYPQYLLTSAYFGMTDTNLRHFTIDLQKPGDTLTVHARGMTTYVLAKSLRLRDVLLGNPLTSHPGLSMPDTFNNCERILLRGAVAHGELDYQSYMDSARAALYDSLLVQLRDSSKEQLLHGYLTQQFGVTLYYYDRAGNLIKTVSPAGVVPLDTSLLNSVNSAREHRDYSSGSVYAYHNKINEYNYNSRNQLVHQHTPDGGNVEHFYDAAGRLIFSLNDKQTSAYSSDTQRLTYNIYDKQNRIIETGEEDTYWPDMFALFDANDLDGLFNYYKHMDRRDVVVTVYDTEATNLQTIAGLEQQTNLRKRVAVVKYFDSLYMADSALLNYTYATHYSYDIEGSVKTLTQDFPVLDAVRQRYKRIDYDYDLISGKVNMLSYNRSFADQYYQRYNYDDDNRLTKVETSSDGYIWRRDAEYMYYQHGPLGRAEFGDLRVQGLDYAYTIQGWLKAVNGDTTNKTLDMGRDGDLTINANDAVGFTLNYFKDDYKAINGSVITSVEPQIKNLYNGNIARQTIAHANDSLRHAFPRYTRNYLYDQMNRLRNTAYGTIDAATTTITPTDEYRNNYTFDPDGNLLTLNRYAFTKPPALGPQLMDSFNYYYFSSGMDNRLSSLTDNAANIGFQDVVYRTDSTIAMYQYDPTGNTTKDLVAGQDSIEWNLYNKVTRARNVDGVHTLSYKYDGMGNRVSKTVTADNGTTLEKKTDYYVHDAQGNILATYRDVITQTPSANTDTRMFSLSGHEVYGSARLGTKGYWPLQLGQGWDYYTGIYDTVRLWERKPWYSLEYQDVIKHDELEPYGHTLTTKLVTAHLTGQKQYEVTDHLGNVLATVSDARQSNGDTTHTDSLAILDYSPAVKSMNDYYPYGMLMPSRYFDDNSGHTTTVTQTVLAPQLHTIIIPWADGGATPFGSGVTASSGSPLLLNDPSTGGGLTYIIHPVSSGLHTGFTITVTAVTSGGNWGATLKQGSSTLATFSINTVGGHTTSFYAPLSGTATLTIRNFGTHSQISISSIQLDTFAFIPTMAVSQISSDNEYKYGFNGKMKDNEWAGVGNYLDYGARGLDTRIARFGSVDPLSKKFPFFTPYQFSGNSPIKFTDLDGKEMYISGTGADQFINLLSILTGLNITKDVNGTLSYAYEIQYVDGSTSAQKTPVVNVSSGPTSTHLRNIVMETIDGGANIEPVTLNVSATQLPAVPYDDYWTNSVDMADLNSAISYPEFQAALIGHFIKERSNPVRTSTILTPDQIMDVAHNQGKDIEKDIMAEAHPGATERIEKGDASLLGKPAGRGIAGHLNDYTTAKFLNILPAGVPGGPSTQSGNIIDVQPVK
ncbi:hypothetical protein CJD36_004445 [Flavipsychrobacter stenotrophus]|uniref:Uncharacterized protein n=1 Tax=Flavipsychrobacter stenotrophus TaxID=2077091 RepID=A0A2S7T1B8_9BACT|nr:hypothetical protein [Flavipsychrobacter stenotrophus]PQJ12999.1 hypothetical protein CJD36_004445 [Flavipsychrobacter stenotrophus]